jgi:hypothetical protein
MDAKDILPVVGVAVGWALKEFSDSFHEREQDVRRSGKLSWAFSN